MKRLIPVLAVLLVSVLAPAKGAHAKDLCRGVDELRLSDPDKPARLMTTPPYVGLLPTGELQRFARRSKPLESDLALSADRVSCLESLTGARLTALRAGTSYRFRLQTSEGPLIVYHTADIVGGESLAPPPETKTPIKPPEPEADESAAEKAETLRGERKFKEALPLAKEAAREAEEAFGPEHLEVATALHKVAELYLLAGQTEEAEPLYKRSLAIRERVLGPDHIDVAESLDHLADLYSVKGEYGRAAELWERALAIRERGLGPDHPWATITAVVLAETYSRLGRQEDADRLLDHVRESPPGKTVEGGPTPSSTDYVKQGTIFIGLGLPERAVGSFGRALEIDPKDIEAYNTRGMAHMAQGDFELAEADYRKALEIDPHYSPAYKNMAMVHYMTGRYDMAAADYSQMLTIDPKNVSAYNGRGMVYAWRGDYERALEDFSKAIELDPQSPDSYLNLGALYEMGAGDAEEACRNFHRACDLGKCDPLEERKAQGLCN